MSPEDGARRLRDHAQALQARRNQRARTLRRLRRLLTPLRSVYTGGGITARERAKLLRSYPR